MKRLMAAALVLSAIGAAGIWFGLPVYAENQFRQSLDAWVDSRPGGKAGYAVAKLDYWSGKATIGSLTEVIEVGSGGTPVQLVVTFDELVIEGYDYQAAVRAAQGASMPEDRIAGLIAWQSFSVSNEAGSLTGRGGAGSISDFAAERVDPLSPMTAEGVRFGMLRQAPVELAYQAETVTASAKAGPFVAENFDSGSLSRLELGELDANFAEGDETALSVAWEVVAAGQLSRGEPAQLAGLEILGLVLRFEGMATGEAGGARAQPVNGLIRWDTYRLTGVRFDEKTFDLYQQLFDILGRGDVRLSDPQTAALLETAIRIMERSESLQVGAGKAVVENLAMDVGNIQELTVDRMEATDVRGLKFGRLETFGQSQKDALGNQSTVVRSSLSAVDLSAFPAYLRRVFGNPVTTEGLEGAHAFYRDNTISAAIPAIDLGVWEMTGQRIVTPEGQEITVDRMVLDRLRADEEGNIEISFVTDGLKLDSSAFVPDGDPNADMAAAVLNAQGIEKLKMDMALAVEFSPARGDMVLSRAGLGVDGIALMDVAGAFSGLDIEQMRQLPSEARPSALMSMNIDQLSVALTDLGGRDIAFALLGDQSGATSEQMAQALSEQANQFIGGLGSQRALSIADAVAEFVLIGGTLIINAQSDRPTPLAQLMILAQTEGPAVVLDILKVVAEHTPE